MNCIWDYIINVDIQVKLYPLIRNRLVSKKYYSKGESYMNSIHNMDALRANMQLKSTNNVVSKSMERLSSGLKINRAADDAAGLRISEKMRAHIKSTAQATRNTLDGISIVQIADSAMDEMTNILNRVRELSITAANETNTTADRETIQVEINELLSELDGISNRTEFNKMPLLNGLYGQDVSASSSTSLKDIVQYVTSSGGVNDKYTINGKDYASGIVDFSNLNSPSDINKLVGQGFNYTCCTCTMYYSVKFVNGDPDTSKLNLNDPIMEVDIRGINNGVELAEKIKETAYGQSNFEYNPSSPNLPANATSFVKHYSQIATDNGKVYIYDNRPNYSNNTWPTANNSGSFSTGVYGETIPDTIPYADIVLQVGPLEVQTFKIDLPTVTLKALSLDNPTLSVLSHDEAIETLSRVDKAIAHISTERSRMGSYQNRLEHIINNLGNTEENLQASESIIRDADMSEEMIAYTQKNTILQANQLMLAQANQRHEAALRGLIFNSQA